MPRKKKPKFEVYVYQPGDELRYGAPGGGELIRNGYVYDLTSQADVDALNSDQPPPGGARAWLEAGSDGWLHLRRQPPPADASRERCCDGPPQTWVRPRRSATESDLYGRPRG